MTRVVLVHWNAAEAEARASRLRLAGINVLCHSDARANPHDLLTEVPDAFLIDLTRLPSQGRELGGFLRRARVTRRVPLLFLEGDPVKTETARRLLPDALYTTWDHVLLDLASALASPPADPIVPGAMDAYAGTPLIRKIGVKPSSIVLLVEAPIGFEEILGALPAAARVTRDASQAADIVLLFATSQDELVARFGDAAAHVHSGGRLWILSPRATGRRPPGAREGSVLTQSAVRAFGLDRGWVDYKVSAVDAAWSGLCFARRSLKE